MCNCSLVFSCFVQTLFLRVTYMNYFFYCFNSLCSSINFTPIDFHILFFVLGLFTYFFRRDVSLLSLLLNVKIQLILQQTIFFLFLKFIKAITCPTQDDCHPKCQWKCDSPVCNQVCEPICEPPKCSTRCQVCVQQISYLEWHFMIISFSAAGTGARLLQVCD